jgi:hypothetical protein
MVKSVTCLVPFGVAAQPPLAFLLVIIFIPGYLFIVLYKHGAIRPQTLFRALKYYIVILGSRPDHTCWAVDGKFVWLD